VAEVVIEGAAELAAALGRLSEAAAGEALRAAVRSAGLLVQNDAKTLAPYRTGTLRRSIHTEVEGDGQHAEASVGTDVIYAARLEFGFEGTDSRGRTYHQPARPYLRPALDQNMDAAAHEIGAALRKALESAI
jgi:HK97 gp10 family phage protein